MCPGTNGCVTVSPSRSKPVQHDEDRPADQRCRRVADADGVRRRASGTTGAWPRRITTSASGPSSARLPLGDAGRRVHPTASGAAPPGRQTAARNNLESHRYSSPPPPGPPRADTAARRRVRLRPVQLRNTLYNGRTDRARAITRSLHGVGSSRPEARAFTGTTCPAWSALHSVLRRQQERRATIRYIKPV